jgi:hypothetical protein
MSLAQMQESSSPITNMGNGGEAIGRLRRVPASGSLPGRGSATNLKQMACRLGKLPIQRAGLRHNSDENGSG